MSDNPFEKRFLRERKARKAAEQILESKSLELYQSNQALQSLTEILELKVTERTKQAEKERNKALALSKAKSEFVATMSHEIRTPINGIIGALNLLESEVATKECHRLLDIADHSANVLLHIINDILDFSKIEAGQMEIENIAYNLKEQCQNSLLPFKKKCEEKHIKLKLEWSDAIPSWQLGDPYRVTQILNNYLSNAVKFTESGGITLKAQHVNDHIKLDVIDSGLGISTEGLNKLFVDFSQVDASTTRQFGGTGLGLVITKNLAEIMGGSVGVESTEGKGSMFWAQLPNNPTKAQGLKPQSSNSFKTQPKKSSRILLVDDNMVNRQIGQKILEKLGHEVELAENGIEAVSAFKKDTSIDESRFDIVLMDCQMPQMDGFEATKAIRSLGVSTPIIALTANTSEEDRRRAMDSGMNDFLSKPFKVDDIQAIITSFQ